jgi:hypothetical protein
VIDKTPLPPTVLRAAQDAYYEATRYKSVIADLDVPLTAICNAVMAETARLRTIHTATINSTASHSDLVACVLDNPAMFRDDFMAWLKDNFHVWDRFKREADWIRSRGRKHYSARTILEVLRHESSLADTDAEFKLNNDNVPDLARLYMLACGADEFFDVRVQAKAERLL